MESLSGFNVFVQVAETRSFVAAGRALGISASAIGKSVARLEVNNSLITSSSPDLCSPQTADLCRSPDTNIRRVLF